MPDTNQVIIDYTNHRGERAKRVILPINIVYEATDWHPEAQWILRAYDVEKAAFRAFAMKDIHSWQSVEG